MRIISVCFLLLAGWSSLMGQDSIHLRECLEIGLEQNYSLRIVRNREEISDNNVTWANAGFLPTINMSAGYSGSLYQYDRTVYRENADQLRHNSYNQTVTAGPGLTWDLFDGFYVQTNYERLQELQKQGKITTRIAVEDFIAAVTAEYYNLVQQKMRLQNYEYAVSLSRERLRIVEARYLIGSFSRLDLLQARVDFNADSSKLMTQQEMVLTSMIRLNELMAADNVNARLAVADTVIAINTNLDWDELERRTLETNAELLHSETDIRLAELNLKSLKSRNYPYVVMNAGYGYTWNSYGSGTTRRRGYLGMNAGVTVGMTLFDGNRRREQSNARIEIENSVLEREALQRALIANLANFWQAYRNNLNLLQLEIENRISAKDNYEIAMERYLLGDLSGIEMREAQQNLLDAEERILSVLYNTKICEISLRQISGEVRIYLD